ncbi:hypothetical protein FACS1894120_6350 [Clostridia bacterium]|nr:hypothetical protein FACS1894120_6350 [Clostridia bacterium]
MTKKFIALFAFIAVFAVSGCTDISARILTVDPFENSENSEGSVGSGDSGISAGDLGTGAAQAENGAAAPELAVFGIPASAAVNTIFVGDNYSSDVIGVRDDSGGSVVPFEQVISNIALTPRRVADVYVHYGDNDIPVTEAIKQSAAFVRGKTQQDTADGTPPVTIALMFYPPVSDEIAETENVGGYVECIQIIKAVVSDASVTVIKPYGASAEYTKRLREAVSGIAEFVTP